MADLTYSVSIPRTPQELEQAIQRYRSSDLEENELFHQWQAIRLAALAQRPVEANDSISGEDSY
jgi:hypothetical protein